MTEVHHVPDESTRTKHITKDDKKIQVQPGALKVMWAKDPHSWRQNDGKGPFELIQVMWLEVTGSIKLNQLEKGVTYKLAFNVKVKKDAFGFEEPVQVMGRVANENHVWKKVYLNNLARDTNIDIPGDLTFCLENNKYYGTNDEFSFGLFEIWSGTWKGGLVINSVTISKIV